MRGALQRRGYFFMIDAAIASVILFLGIVILFGASVRTPEDTQTVLRAEDYTSIMLTQPLSKSTNAYYTSQLLPAGLVPTPDTTALEEIAYLSIRAQQGCVPCAQHMYSFAQSMTDQVLESQQGAAIYLNGTLVYNRSSAPINIFITRPTLIYVQLNETSMVGPMRAELHIW